MPHKDPEIRALYHREYAKARKEELKAYRTKYRQDNPEKEHIWQEVYRNKSIEKRKAYARYVRYGVDIEQFTQMLLQQNNSCVICKKEFTKTPHIDHCHTSGKVRGLLCSSCNTGLGVYEKNAVSFEKYLKANG